MIVLTSTEKLQLVLSAGTADVDVNYNDRTATAYGPADSQQTAATAATNDICTAPAASTSREINEVTVSVKTTGGTATLQKFNSSGSVTTIVWKAVVGASDQVFYVHGYGIKVTDANGNIKTTNTVTQRTRQVFLSGSSATYTTPANCKQIFVRAKGGGGGGSGSGSTGPNNGTTGTASVFNSITAAGGGGGNSAGNAGAVGGTGGSGTASLRIAGIGGGNVYIYPVSVTNAISYGGQGGGAGGGASGSNAPGNGGAGVANSGGGGGGGGLATATFAGIAASFFGVGGGEGEYLELIINNPASTYTYTVGGGGAGAGAGTAGGAGGNGGSGYVTVDEMY